MSTPNLEARFMTAATSGPPTEAQREAVAANQKSTLIAATIIDDNVPDGRYKALALTALEEALMWANKGVFAEGETK